MRANTETSRSSARARAATTMSIRKKLKLHRAKFFFKLWDILSVVCEEAKKNREEDVAW